MVDSIIIHLLLDPWNLKKGLDLRGEDKTAVSIKIYQRFLP